MLSAAKLRWESSDFYRHGRMGQKQDGVDIWGHDEERHIGIQCKNTVGGISLGVIQAELESAEAFAPKLDRLYSVYSHNGEARCSPAKGCTRTFRSAP